MVLQSRLHSILSVPEVLRLIEEEGADVNLRDVDGSTALHVARSSAVARALLDHGAGVNAKNSRGMSPLHRSRNAGVSRVLLDSGAEVNALDSRGNTALHYANDRATVQQLLDHGADPHVRNCEGQTPIHMSLYAFKVVALKKAGACIDSADGTGKTLLMKKSKCFNTCGFLEQLLAMHPCDRLMDIEGRTAIDFTIDAAVRRRMLVYRKDENWRRRRVLVLLREQKQKCFVARDDLLLRVVSVLPRGVFRSVVVFL